MSPPDLQQPYSYHRRTASEPDHRRYPGWRKMTEQEWNSPQWQRAHCVKNLQQLRNVTGELLSDTFFADLERDQREHATMSLLITPHMINTMAVDAPIDGPGSLTDAHPRPAGAPGGDAGLPASNTDRAGCRGLGWRPGQLAVATARSVRRRSAGHRLHPRHPFGEQGVDRPTPALGRRSRSLRDRTTGRHRTRSRYPCRTTSTSAT